MLDLIETVFINSLLGCLVALAIFVGFFVWLNTREAKRDITPLSQLRKTKDKDTSRPEVKTPKLKPEQAAKPKSEVL